MFDGAFAAVPIKEGELIEKGVMRRLPEGFDGNTCPYIFTWSNERPNKVRERHVQLTPRKWIYHVHIGMKRRHCVLQEYCDL